MSFSDPFFREVGSGPGVVCLHANASTSGQWRALMDSLAPRFHVLAADSLGAGKSPAWPSDRQVSLLDEVELLRPVFDRAGERFTLVAHSYGAAIALVAAVTEPDRIQALALYEPTLFGLIDAQSPPPNDADGIRVAAASAATAVEAGDLDLAAEHFMDFWMGKGTWARTPEPRRGPIAGSLVNVRGWARALFEEPTPLSAFAELNVPTLYMSGSESPASSRGVARLLTRTIPNVQIVEFDGLGHMAPVTHANVVNAAISRFVEQSTSPGGSASVPTFLA